jgi:DNA replication protein DnaC
MDEDDVFHRLALERVKSCNNAAGDLENYECPECHNKGFLVDLWNDGSIYADNVYSRPCTCSKIRRNIAHLKKMGLLESVRGSSIRNFETGSPYQAEMKRKTLEFLDHGNGAWFFVGGQSGCGKTTICNYIYGRMLNAGTDCYYMPWVSESKKLRRYAMDPEGFNRHCKDLLRAELLYIDDFLKSKLPTDAELSIAFEIIDSRYKSKRMTIISSERLLHEIDGLDEAIGSRILERAGYFVTDVARSPARNYRKRKKAAPGATNTGDRNGEN